MAVDHAKWPQLITQYVQETESLFLWTYYEKQKLSHTTTNIVFSSWRNSTVKKYHKHLKKWIQFAIDINILLIYLSSKQVWEKVYQDYMEKRCISYFCSGSRMCSFIPLKVWHFGNSTNKLNGLHQLKKPCLPLEIADCDLRFWFCAQRD